MSKSLRRVRAALDAAGVVVTITEFDEGTRTAAAAAAAVGCQVDQIAKSILFQGADSGAAILFITAGGNQVCADKATSLAGEPLTKADAALVRRQTGFAIGGVSPIAHLSPPRAFFDPHLLTFSEVWAAAGTPRHVFAMAPARLHELSGAAEADFTIQPKM